MAEVQHHEISSYLSARVLASQAGNSEAALLLSQSLLEEESADKLLSRIVTFLMEKAADLKPMAGGAKPPETGAEEDDEE